MVLDKIKSKDVLFLFILIISTPQIRSYKCFWDYIHDAVYEENDNADDDVQPIPPPTVTDALTESPQLPEKETEMVDDVGNQHLTHVSNFQISVPLVVEEGGSSQPQLSVSSKYDSSAPDDATSFFNFDLYLALNRTTSTDAKDGIYGVPPLGFLVALAMVVACLLVEIAFCRKYQILRSKVEELEEKLAHQAEESALSTDDIEELMEEKGDISDKSALLTSRWSADKIFYFLKQLATDVEDFDEEDEKVNYLTDDFLQEISKYIASQDSLRKNLEILTPESLLRIGKFYHRHFSRSQEACEREIKVNVGVYVNGVAATQDKN